MIKKIFYSFIVFLFVLSLLWALFYLVAGHVMPYKAGSRFQGLFVLFFFISFGAGAVSFAGLNEK